MVAEQTGDDCDRAVNIVPRDLNASTIPCLKLSSFARTRLDFTEPRPKRSRARVQKPILEPERMFEPGLSAFIALGKPACDKAPQATRRGFATGIRRITGDRTREEDRITVAMVQDCPDATAACGGSRGLVRDTRMGESYHQRGGCPGDVG